MNPRVNIIPPSDAECASEISILKLKKLMQKARKAQKAADRLEQAVYASIEDLRIDIHSPTGAKNAVSLKHAIYKYLHTGAYGLREILKEIRMWHSAERGA